MTRDAEAAERMAQCLDEDDMLIQTRGFLPVADRLQEAAALLRALAAENARLREHLEWYADQCCELGSSHECCGRMAEDDCSGCRARAALAQTDPAP